ncbi:MAG: hypothetical protein NT165_03705 [Candidatus Falkowbacteria bacterium]|nr:hypothetical protein [Candidatus Falkowbacteria bacterium]
MSVRREIIDGIINPSAGYLNGGTSPSATSVFDALGLGANNGKFKINIDNVVYDNVAVNLSTTGSEVAGITVANSSTANQPMTTSACEESMVVPAGQIRITRITLYGTAGANTITVQVRTASGGGGTLLGTLTGTLPGSTANFDVTGTEFAVTPGSTIYLRITASANQGYLYGPAGGNMSKVVYFKPIVGLGTTSAIASAVQTAIRNITGGLETVVYSTNKYVITSGIAGQASQILKLIAPSTGADISGNGGTLYLDCGANAIQVAGVGHTQNILGKLLGGKNPSAISIFQTLANGANNGKIKVSIDGTVYDNVAIDLMNNVQTVVAGLIGNGGGSFSGGYTAQSFLANDTGYITSITITADNWTAGTRTLQIRQGENINGTIIATVTATAPGGGTQPLTWTFATPVQLIRGQVYCFTFEGGSARFEYRSGMYGYTNGKAYNGAWQSANVQFSMSGYPWLSIASLSDVANILQSRLRLVTGSTELFIYNLVLGRFELTSTKAFNGSVLKMLAPSTGTDITGNGATSYLDCASNAIEIPGYSDYNKIAKLNDKGEIPSAVLPSGSFCAYYRNSQVNYGFGSPIKFENKIADNMNEYDPTTGKFTAKNSGVYLVTGITYLFINYSSSDMGARLGLYKNNVLYQSQGTNEVGGTIITDLTYSFVVQLVAGDQFFLSNTAGAYPDAWANANAQATLNIVRII